METPVKERLVGAAVLVAVVVLVVPALLSGPREPAPPVAAGQEEVRRVEIDLTAPGQAVTGGAPHVVPAQPPAEPASAQPPGAAPAAAPPEAPAAAAAVGGWAVQVAALSNSESAAAMAAELKRRGFPAFVAQHEAGGRQLYRVRVGPEVRRDSAAALAERLKDAGYKPTVVASP